MSKVGMTVTYTPTAEEQPMSADTPQAALITGWDEETEKATLAVFAKRANYFWVKEGAMEGTTSGTFQQSPSGQGGTGQGQGGQGGTLPSRKTATHA